MALQFCLLCYLHDESFSRRSAVVLCGCCRCHCLICLQPNLFCYLSFSLPSFCPGRCYVFHNVYVWRRHALLLLNENFIFFSSMFIFLFVSDYDHFSLVNLWEWYLKCFP